MRSFGANFITQKTSAYAAPFLTGVFNFAAGTVRISDRTRTVSGNQYLGVVHDWGAIAAPLTGPGAAFDVPQTTVLVANAALFESGSRRFSDYFPHILGSVRVDLYWNFEDPASPGTIYTEAAMAAVPHDEPDYDTEYASLVLVPRWQLYGDREVCEAIDRTRFPNAPTSYRGQVFPIVFGDVPAVPCVRFNANKRLFAVAESLSAAPIASVGQRYWDGYPISETDVSIDFDVANSLNVDFVPKEASRTGSEPEERINAVRDSPTDWDYGEEISNGSNAVGSYHNISAFDNAVWQRIYMNPEYFRSANRISRVGISFGNGPSPRPLSGLPVQMAVVPGEIDPFANSFGDDLWTQYPSVDIDRSDIESENLPGNIDRGAYIPTTMYPGRHYWIAFGTPNTVSNSPPNFVDEVPIPIGTALAPERGISENARTSDGTLLSGPVSFAAWLMRVGPIERAEATDPNLAVDDLDNGIDSPYIAEHFRVEKAVVAAKLGVKTKQIAGVTAEGSLRVTLSRASAFGEITETVADVEIKASDMLLSSTSYGWSDAEIAQPILIKPGDYVIEVTGQVDVTTGRFGGILIQGTTRPLFGGFSSGNISSGTRSARIVPWPPYRTRPPSLLVNAPTGDPQPIHMALRITALKFTSLGNIEAESSGVTVRQIQASHDVPEGVRVACDAVVSTTRLDQVVEILLNRAGALDAELDLAGTFAATGASLGSTYKTRGAVIGQMTYKELLPRMAFENRCGFDWSGPLCRLVFIPNPGQSSIRTLTLDDIRRKSDNSPAPALSISRMKHAEIINVIDARFSKNYGEVFTVVYEEPGKLVEIADEFLNALERRKSQSSIDALGEQTDPERFDYEWVRDQTHAELVTDFWILWFGLPPRIINARGYRNALEFERFDTIAYDLTPEITIGESAGSGAGFGGGGFGENGFGGMASLPYTSKGRTFDGITSSIKWLIEEMIVDWSAKPHATQVRAREW